MERTSSQARLTFAPAPFTAYAVCALQVHCTDLSSCHLSEFSGEPCYDRNMLNPRAMQVLFFCSAILLSGCRATPPGIVEKYAATYAKRWLLVPNSHQANPVAATAANIEFGRASYSRYCNTCHGLDGAGMGVAFGAHMSPPAPSLASAQVQAYSDSQLKWIIDNGLWPSGMPGSQGVLTEQQIWSIVLYLRHLTPAGGLASAEAENARPIQFCNIRGIEDVPEVSCGDLPALAENAHG